MLEIIGFIVLVAIGIISGYLIFASTILIFGMGGGTFDKMLLLFIGCLWIAFVYFTVSVAPFTITMVIL